MEDVMSLICATFSFTDFQKVTIKEVLQCWSYVLFVELRGPCSKKMQIFFKPGVQHGRQGIQKMQPNQYIYIITYIS